MPEHDKKLSWQNLRKEWYKLRDSLRERGMKRIAPAATVLLALAVLAALFTVQGRSPQNTAPPLPIAPDSPVPPFQYVIQTDPQNEHMLALFFAREGELVRVASYPFAGEELPEADRDILRRGLALRDSAELQSTLEDYHPYVRWG